MLIKINSIITVVLLLTTTSIFAQSNINVPYFETLSSNEICGLHDCGPNIGIKAPIKGGYLFDGDAKKIFGRKFKTKGLFFKRGGIFDNSPCVSRTPNDNEFTTLREGTLHGSLDTSKKTEFDSKITADLAKIINQYTDITETVKADLLKELNRTVDLKSEASIELVYRIIQLDNSFLDSEVEECRKIMTKREKVIIGLSVLTVSGNWNSDVLKDTFINFEANTEAFKLFDTETKYKYEQSKNTVLNAKFEPFSMVFYVSYRMKS